MTGRWVSPVVSGGLLEMTRCCGPTFGHDQPDASGHEWNLTRNNRTLVLVHPVTSSSASGHHLTVGIGRLVFEERDDVAAIR